MPPHKVAIIGAGFAGLIAARELQSLGIGVEIFEARNRIGGRAWTETRMGRPLELGATWVHWMQPHIWAEITRYQQTVYPSPSDCDAYWVTQGKVIAGTEREMDALLAKPQAKVFEGSRDFFPNPQDPLAILRPESGTPEKIQQAFRDADQRSVLASLEDGDFSQEEKDLCNAYWSAGYIGDPHQGSSLMAKQWAALSDHRLSLVDEQTLRFKLTEGMQGIYQAIADELTCPIHLETPVKAVAYSDRQAQLTLADDSTVVADALIVTVPLGALDNLSFSPELPDPLPSLIEEKWNSTGCKIWIKVRGHHKILGYAPSPAKINVLRSEFFMDDGTTICVGFGSDHTQVDLTSLEDAQEILNQWRPDLEAIDCTGHDWVDDRWSGQAWATLKKGQFTHGWHHFEQDMGSLYFAGSDYARGWRGVVVDGAIETAYRISRKVAHDLKTR